MEWISVRDKLPEKYTYVLIKSAWENEYVIGFTDWTYWRSRTGRNINGVTHWMPLPEPPKRWVKKDIKIKTSKGRTIKKIIVDFLNDDWLLAPIAFMYFMQLILIALFWR